MNNAYNCYRNMQRTSFASTAKITATNKFFNSTTSLNPGDYEEKGGLTNLPVSRLEQLKAEKNLSPKSIDKRVNNFINEKVKTNQGAATIVFEELTANTGKVHR